jgi:hypothetical protein
MLAEDKLETQEIVLEPARFRRSRRVGRRSAKNGPANWSGSPPRSSNAFSFVPDM